jgi:hypothetical protein
MALFIARIELHSSTYQDYTNLHAYMAAEGYATTIRGSNSLTYQLPPAEYHLDGNFTCDQALEKAKRAAQRTAKSFAAVVSEATSISWFGLPTVQPANSLVRTLLGG